MFKAWLTLPDNPRHEMDAEFRRSEAIDSVTIAGEKEGVGGNKLNSLI